MIAVPSARARRSVFALTGLVVLVLTTSATPPVVLGDADFADPFVLRDRATYYAFATGTDGQHVQAARSSDLATWAKLPDALPSLPSWAARMDRLTWAPAVLRRGPRFVLYYTTRHAASGFQCISRAVAERPEGPYLDTSTRPFVCDIEGERSYCGSIDPSPFVDPQGRAFLYWKSDENHPQCRGTPRIWGQRLTDDGLDLTGAAVPLLAMAEPWERPLVEGPSMLANGGAYYLFYSANWYESPNYAVGYAKCNDPLGPCTKVTVESPLVKSGASVLGPGGQEFFDDDSGAKWMAYHAWTAPNASYATGGARSLRLARVAFDTGEPIVRTAPERRGEVLARSQ